MRKAIVVTGLPASGKTTVARHIAFTLSWKLLDKDEFLENLYELQGVNSLHDRKKLSRQSDLLFRKEAERAISPVLVSHWRPTNDVTDSGTPTDWIKRNFNQIAEVTCNCSPQTAQRRFLERRRHPGHLDKERNPSELSRQMQDLSGAYPLGIGTVIEVNTEGAINFTSMMAQLRRYFGTTPRD